LTTDLDRARELLAEDHAAIADRIADANPWICTRIGIDFAAWAGPILASYELGDARIHMVGSAAVGFSLRAEQPGRPFRFAGGSENPSDLDIAIVSEVLFNDCWGELVREDRTEGISSASRTREHVYWGRIDDGILPQRAATRRRLRDMVNEVSRSAEFRGYPASIRVYRTRPDLIGYVRNGLRLLERSIQE
jgi:hypothetical protein